MLGTVVRIDGYDPVTAATVSLRAASHDLPAVCHLADTVWWPAIAQLPTLRYDLFDGGFGDAISAPSSSLTLVTEPFPTLPRLALADARFQLWTGEVGTPFDDWTLRFDGRVTEQPQIADGIASVTFAVDDAWLDEPLLKLYEGTTGAEGEAAQKGVPKPLSIGAPRYVPGVMIDSVNTILQLSAYGPVEGVDAAMEKLSRFGAPSANYATFAALKAAAIPAGRWATANAVGMVRHGAPLTGQSSYILRGDTGGGRARLPGAIISRIATLAGASDRVSVASLAALNAARPWPLSLWLAEQITPRDIIQRIAASVNAVAGVSWLGKLFVVPIHLGEPTTTLRSDGTAMPPVGNVAQVAAGQPFWRLALQAERTWQVHALGDVAFTAALIERGRYDPAETYREGHIVDLADGSRWLYVSQTPGSAAPPDLVWSLLSPATKAVDITYDDGKTIEELKPAEPGATNSADPQSPFGPGATVGVFIDDLDRVRTDLDIATPSLFDVVRLVGTTNSILQAKTTLDGKAIGTVVVQVREVTESAVETLSLIGAKNAAGTAINLSVDTVLVDEHTTIAQRFTQLQAYSDLGLSALATSLTQTIVTANEATSRRIDTFEATLNGPGGLSAKVTSLVTAVAATVDANTATASRVDTVEASIGGENGLSAKVAFLTSAVVTAGGDTVAKAVLSLKANGRVGGLVATNDGQALTLDLDFDVVRIFRPDGYLLFQASGSKVYMPSVVIDTLELNTAVTPVRVSATSAIAGGTTGAGTGGDMLANQTIARMSASITMSVAGWIEVIATCKQRFSDNTGPHEWGAAIDINGALLPEAFSYGQRAGDSVAIMGAFYAAAAGTYTVNFRWAADASIQLQSRAMFVKGYPFTQ